MLLCIAGDSLHATLVELSCCDGVHIADKAQNINQLSPRGNSLLSLHLWVIISGLCLASLSESWHRREDHTGFHLSGPLQSKVFHSHNKALS